MESRKLNPWLLILISILVAIVVTRVAVSVSEGRRNIDRTG
jgi:hypothetical protein